MFAKIGLHGASVIASRPSTSERFGSCMNVHVSEQLLAIDKPLLASRPLASERPDAAMNKPMPLHRPLVVGLVITAWPRALEVLLAGVSVRVRPERQRRPELLVAAGPFARELEIDGDRFGALWRRHVVHAALVFGEGRSAPESGPAARPFAVLRWRFGRLIRF